MKTRLWLAVFSLELVMGCGNGSSSTDAGTNEAGPVPDAADDAPIVNVSCGDKGTCPHACCEEYPNDPNIPTYRCIEPTDSCGANIVTCDPGSCGPGETCCGFLSVDGNGNALGRIACVPADAGCGSVQYTYQECAHSSECPASAPSCCVGTPGIDLRPACHAQNPIAPCTPIQ